MNSALPRRTFLADLGMGFTGLALGALLQRDARGAASAVVSLTLGILPPANPTSRRVRRA